MYLADTSASAVKSHQQPYQKLRQPAQIWRPRPAAPKSTYIVDRFGERLRLLRKDRGMTQLDVAVAFGIDRSFISDVERGKKAISLPLLEVIALGFGLNLSELLADI